jgi:hypothetical protein
MSQPGIPRMICSDKSFTNALRMPMQLSISLTLGCSAEIVLSGAPGLNDRYRTEVRSGAHQRMGQDRENQRTHYSRARSRLGDVLRLLYWRRRVSPAGEIQLRVVQAAPGRQMTGTELEVRWHYATDAVDREEQWMHTHQSGRSMTRRLWRAGSPLLGGYE